MSREIRDYRAQIFYIKRTLLLLNRLTQLHFRLLVEEFDIEIITGM